jgi:hypothetical protein
MGIDTHALNFIRYVSKGERLGRVATLGRQSLQIAGLAAQFGNHCEELLVRRFGAELVDSYDYSNYEGATHIVDMNRPLAESRQYDTVIDCGCLEHIYNAPQALANVSALCAIGGRIIHVLPANNFCGHGFWQFSPELFFSLYAKANGYTETQVFLADLNKAKIWYQVVPAVNERAEIRSRSPIYVMCGTVKNSLYLSHDIQQSDYIQLWNANVPTNQEGLGSRLKMAIKRNSRLYRWGLAVRNRSRSCAQAIRNPTSLSSTNRHLKKHRVSDLLNL